MAIAFESIGAISTGTGTAVSTSAPAGVVSGDLLVLLVGNKDGTTEPSTPSGWSLVANDDMFFNDSHFALYYREADGSGADTPTVTLSASENWHSIMARYSGVDHAAGLHDWEWSTRNGDDPYTVSNYSAGVPSDGCLSVFGFSSGFTNGDSTPSSLTAGYTARESSNTAWGKIAFGDGEFDTSGDASLSLDFNGSIRGRVIIALFEAAAGGGGPDYTLTATKEDIAYTGQDVTLTVSRKLTAQPPTVEYTPQDIGLSIGRVLAATPESVEYAGQSVVLAIARKLPATREDIAYSPQDATLTYTPVGGPDYTLAATVENVAYTPQDAALKVSRKLAAAVASIEYAQQDATLTRSYTLTASVFSTEYTGQAAGLKVSRKLTAALESVEYASQAAGLTYSGADLQYRPDVLGTANSQLILGRANASITLGQAH